ncbi:MAG: hypothetical protein AAB296_10940, partial [Candidatus Desantisbacteria bacterium]
MPPTPPFLTVKAKFDDTTTGANGLLDSNEEASLILSISNTGEGSGFGMEILPSVDNTVVTVQEIIKAGAVLSGETKEIRIPISASKDAQNGAVTITIATKEMNGYDAQTVRFTIPVHRVEMPVLEIADIGKVIINDKPPVIKAATAEVKKKMESLVQIKGNGNGIIENEEVVEVTVPVKNIGKGDAYGVKLRITSIDSEIEVLSKEIVLGNIKAGESKDGKFLFAIPKTYLAKNSPTPNVLEFSLEACDMRKAITPAGRDLSLPYHLRLPQLDLYSYKIYDGGTPSTESRGNKNGFIEQGEIIGFWVNFENTGELYAQDVTVELSTEKNGMVINKGKAELGRIEAGKTSKQARFLFTVQRAALTGNLPLKIVLKEATFPLKE